MAFYIPDFAGHLSCRAEPALTVGAQQLQHPDRRVLLWGDGRGYDAGVDLSVGAILAFSAIIIVLAVGAGSAVRYVDAHSALEARVHGIWRALPPRKE
jgi:hypothetical protein